MDALIGNFNRHNGNCGVLVNNDGDVKIAPIYDCGSTLFAQLTDKQINDILKHENEFCNKAILKIVPKKKY